MSSLTKSTLLLALILAGIGSAASAVQAQTADDKDGTKDCCTSLEDRISKLENHVDKGNDKVSVTVSGWVSESINQWNDGGDTGKSAMPKP